MHELHFLPAYQDRGSIFDDSLDIEQKPPY